MFGRKVKVIEIGKGTINFINAKEKPNGLVFRRSIFGKKEFVIIDEKEKQNLYFVDKKGNKYYFISDTSLRVLNPKSEEVQELNRELLAQIIDQNVFENILVSIRTLPKFLILIFILAGLFAGMSITLLSYQLGWI